MTMSTTELIEHLKLLAIVESSNGRLIQGGFMNDAASRLEELENANQWIPVSVRLPEHSTDVLTLVRPDASIRQTVAGYFPLTRYDTTPMGWLEFPDPDKELNVTHWMPLPNKPEILT